MYINVHDATKMGFHFGAVHKLAHSPKGKRNPAFVTRNTMQEDLQRFIEELRTRVSIVDVVGAKVKLTKKGREYGGLCPFHNEKTPSFTVNEAKGFYHCFGCGAHGDIVKFEMEANGLPFMDALTKLAHQAGLAMPQFNKKGKEEAEARKSLYEIMEQACTFFERELRMPAGAEGLKYFREKRGLTKETIEKFRLGFAPNNNALMAALKSENISEKDLKDLGLIAIPEDKSRRPHDFFRNRVMIPITNKQGKIIAFGGRVMEKIEPKYLNSPDTPIFNKRRNLYNLDKAREAAYKEKKLIICEGYMDVIALDSYGFNYAVAPLGTALTEEQIMEAWRVCPEPTLCLDGDAPGVKAAMRAVDRVLPILKAGYSLKFLFLPDNQDPDEYLNAHGANSFAALLKNTSPLIDILWRKYTENEAASTPEQKALIEQTLLAEVAKIKDPTVRSYYAQEIRTRIYKAFKQTPWQQSAPRSITPPRQTYAPRSVPPSAPSAPPRREQPKPTPAANSYYKKSPPRAARSIIAHTAADPEALRQTASDKRDKNIRLIAASFLIYPELIEDFEENIFYDEIKNESLKKLLQQISDTYNSADSPLNGAELEALLCQSPACKQAVSALWELNMLKERKPFINDLRKTIKTSLKENRLSEIEEEKKRLYQNLTEENYTRIKELDAEKSQILAAAND